MSNGPDYWFTSNQHSFISLDGLTGSQEEGMYTVFKDTAECSVTEAAEDPESERTGCGAPEIVYPHMNDSRRNQYTSLSVTED